MHDKRQIERRTCTSSSYIFRRHCRSLVLLLPLFLRRLFASQCTIFAHLSGCRVGARCLSMRHAPHARHLRENELFLLSRCRCCCLFPASFSSQRCIECRHRIARVRRRRNDATEARSRSQWLEVSPRIARRCHSTRRRYNTKDTVLCLFALSLFLISFFSFYSIFPFSFLHILFPFLLILSFARFYFEVIFFLSIPISLLI